MNQKMKKREFLRNLFFGLSGYFITSSISPHVKAIELLNTIPDSMPTDVQKQLLSDPPRRTLLAETAFCIGYTGAAKIKCNSALK